MDRVICFRVLGTLEFAVHETIDRNCHDVFHIQYEIVSIEHGVQLES